MLFVSRVETILDKEHISWPLIKKAQENSESQDAIKGTNEVGRKG
jgi:hypothetical protein